LSDEEQPAPNAGDENHAVKGIRKISW